MGMFRSFFRWLTGRTKPGGFDFQNSPGIIIRPNGTWVVASKHNLSQMSQKPTQQVVKKPIAISAPPIIGKDLDWSTTEECTLDVLTFPPDYFPHAKELHSKLDQCVDLDIITSYQHKQSQNNVYMLFVELPCTQDAAQNMKKFKQFIKAMEDLYRFKTIQQEKINSLTCSDQSYLVVFEYDPKDNFLKKLNT